jgi:hypothetical protein
MSLDVTNNVLNFSIQIPYLVVIVIIIIIISLLRRK